MRIQADIQHFYVNADPGPNLGFAVILIVKFLNLFFLFLQISILHS